MFDPDGGFVNIMLTLGSLIGLLVSIWLPLAFVTEYKDKGISRKHVLAVVTGLTLYCFLFYVANPSLSFWAVK